MEFMKLEDKDTEKTASTPIGCGYKSLADF